LHENKGSLNLESTCNLVWVATLRSAKNSTSQARFSVRLSDLSVNRG
jgi:hypothetical protein